MVAAGVYLIGRVYSIFTPDAFLVIAYFGLITLFISATIALTQNDIKKVLAYSTCSQLGFMVMALGVGGYTAGLAHLTTHAAFKACLFLGSGSVIHAVHTQDIQEMGGLWKKMPITFGTFLIATLAIAGVPGFAGFYSKDMILATALEFGMRSGNTFHYIFFIGALLTAGMTAFYMFRMVIMTFFGTPRDHHKYNHAHESPPNMTVPLVILAVLSIQFFFSPWFGDLIVKPQSAVDAAVVQIAQPHASEAVHHEAVPAAASAAAEHGGVLHDAAHDEHIAHSAHVTAMYSSIGIGTFGILLAFVVYMFGWINPKTVAERCKPLYLFSLNKWYFDELYEATIINGSKAFSRGCSWFDANVIDGLVNLTAQIGVFVSNLVGKFDNGVVDGAVNAVADITLGSGSILRRMQTGKLFHYVFVLAGGALVIFLVKLKFF